MNPKSTINHNTNKQTILVLYASTGSGHKSAANVIQNALQNIKINYNFNIDIKCLDILDFAIKKIDGNKVLNAYSNIFPFIFDKTWTYNFTCKILWGGGQLWPNFPFKKFEKYLKSIKPNLFICTHMISANICAKARLNLNLNIPIISVPTDYQTEGLWPHKETDLFCVASKHMKKTLIDRSVPEDKIIISGIPVNSASKDIQSSNPIQHLLFKNNNILILAGSIMSSPYLMLRKLIEKSIVSFSSLTNFNFIICTGKDDKYNLHLNRQISKINAKNIKTIGYQPNLNCYFNCFDLIIGKAGGLTITESINAQVPYLVYGKQYAQERVNKNYLIDNKAGYYLENEIMLVDTISKLLKDKSLYKNTINNIKKIKFDQADKTIAIASLEMLGYKCNNTDFPAYNYFLNKPKSKITQNIYLKRKKRACKPGSVK